MMKLMPLQKKEGCNCLYRYVDPRSWQEKPSLREYEIVRETRCGYWIREFFFSNDLKFVYKEGKNNFAKSTREEALKNYYHRKLSHIAFLEDKLRRAKSNYLFAKAEMEKITVVD